MELRSILFLRSESATPEFIDTYVSDLVTNYGWEESEIRTVLAELKNLRNADMDFIFNALKAFIVESFNDMTYEIVPVDRMFTSTGNCRVFKWVFNSQMHTLVLPVSQIEELRVLFLLLDSGTFNLETSGITPMATLRENQRMWQNHSANLGRLGLTGSEPIIPTPSESLDIDESTARFSSAMWFENIQQKTIVLAGVGGIGSYVGFLLSRMKPKAIYIYDDDRVEGVNMAGQLYSSDDIMQFKVDALCRMMRRYSAYHDVFAIRERFTENSEAADIMICGFDSMSARMTFFSAWKQHVLSKSEEERKQCIFIDGRLAAEELQVLCIRGDDDYNIDRYSREFLFSDDEADETLCSYKQTSYMANMIGGIIVNLFTNFVANELVEGLRDLPFFTSYDGSSMMFKTEQ